MFRNQIVQPAQRNSFAAPAFDTFVSKRAQCIVPLVPIPSEGQLGLTVSVAQPQTENARIQFVQLQIVLQARQLTAAGLKGPHSSCRPDTAGGENCVQTVVGAGIDEGHAGFEDAVEKHDFVRLEASGDVNLAADVMAEEHPQPRGRVPWKGDRRLASAVWNRQWPQDCDRCPLLQPVETSLTQSGAYATMDVRGGAVW